MDVLHLKEFTLKRLVLIVTIILALTSCNSEKHYNEWVQKGQDYYYYDNSGNKVKGTERRIGSSTYLFEKDGKMAKGIQIVNGKKKYYDDSGKLTSGWIKIDNDDYYFDEKNGEIKTGWLEYAGDWYYFDSQGKMVKAKKMIIDGQEYTFNDNGVAKAKKNAKKQLEVINHSILGQTWKDKAVRWHEGQKAPYQIFFILEYDESDELQNDIANKVCVYAKARDLDFYDCCFDGFSNSYRKGKEKLTELYDIELYNGTELYDKTTITELSTDGLHYYYHSGSVLIDRRETTEITIKITKKH